MNTTVRYHSGEGRLVNAGGRHVPVTYMLEEWREVNKGSTTILGSIEGPRGLISEHHEEQFLLVLASSLTLRCTLRVMGVPNSYEVVPDGEFVQP
jgi:hypothetical protein